MGPLPFGFASLFTMPLPSSPLSIDITCGGFPAGTLSSDVAKLLVDYFVAATQHRIVCVQEFPGKIPRVTFGEGGEVHKERFLYEGEITINGVVCTVIRIKIREFLVFLGDADLNTVIVMAVCCSLEEIVQFRLGFLTVYGLRVCTCQRLSLLQFGLPVKLLAYLTLDSLKHVVNVAATIILLRVQELAALQLRIPWA